MRKLIVSEFLTLDGVMQAPGDVNEDQDSGFEHGGWQMPYHDDIGGQAIREGMAGAGGFLLGRKTYEIFASYWPKQPADDPFAPTLNGLPKYVVSTTLKEPLSWQNSNLISGNVAEKVRKLKEGDGKDLQVIGSGDLVQTLIQDDLVDVFAVMIHPIVLGSGKRLFREGMGKRQLRLVNSKSTTKGVLMLTYESTQ